MPTVNHFGAIAASLKPRAHALVAETIVVVRDSAKAHSRVDTGEMRDGWTAEQTSDTHGTVYNDVPHTVFNEYGTVKMTAQPMIHPAIDEAKPAFDTGLARLLEP
jgi:HK97 gp10 family phage protein